ncbi:MAG: (deoxy)nucleoside triphosphate pyrophosphohydrolase, partial [Christensenellaceae bacterium]|nr:(deoxy)nucleoside triphosphate pyrophosphohydrolase [Christensenellaceae bacterium]
AIIWKDNKFLICQRPLHKARSLLWEFVGGKVEKNESHEQALVRECYEELGIKVKVGKLFEFVEYAYPDIKIKLYIYNCELIEGQPQILEHRDIKWITMLETDKYNFCPADKKALDNFKLKNKNVY